ncbi:hypothetical protein [Fulvivirga marina]|nr:hypothetical protein [Fulvivirga marina]
MAEEIKEQPKPITDTITVLTFLKRSMPYKILSRHRAHERISNEQ